MSLKISQITNAMTSPDIITNVHSPNSNFPSRKTTLISTFHDPLQLKQFRSYLEEKKLEFNLDCLVALYDFKKRLWWSQLDIVEEATRIFNTFFDSGIYFFFFFFEFF
jgi:hypothetical protein